MGYGTDVRVQLRRDSPGVSWGFRLQGGKEFGAPLSVQRVFNGSPSDGQLQRGDIIVAVDNRDVRHLGQSEAHDIIQNAGLLLTLAIERSGSYNYDSYVPPSDSFSYTEHQGDVPKQFPSPQQQQAWKPVPVENNYQTPNYSNQSAPRYQQHSNQPANQYDSSTRATAPQDYDGAPPVYRSATATFNPSGQGQGYAPQSSPMGQQHSPGGISAGGGQNVQYDQWGNIERSGGQYAHDEEEPYEQKTIGNIKEMFNKPDEVGTQNATSRIKRAQPRAPMRHANEQSSFSTPHFGPTSTPAKSSLTPYRPGAIQRGAPDNRPSHSYVPNIPPETHGIQRTKGLYGYSQDQSLAQSGGGTKGKYVGGFVGVNALIKPEAPAAPVKRPPGQKKDFDPSHSSVLRVLQEEEGRAKNSSTGQQRHEDKYDHHDQQSRGQGQGRGQKVSKGQQWQQQQMQQSSERSPALKQGSSLEALLARDQQLNPQEDPRNQHDPHFASSAATSSQSEYRRPGTSYKPAENKAKQSVNLDDYPIHTSTDRYDYPSAYPSTDTYKSTASFSSSGGSNYQSSSYPVNKPSAPSHQQQQAYGSTSYQQAYGAPSHHGYQYQDIQPSHQAGRYQQFPTSDYSGGIPACDF